MTTGGRRPPRKGPGPNKRGAAPRQRGKPKEQQKRRRNFPSVQITVACDDGDVERLASRARVVELASTAAAPLTERTLRSLVDRTPDGFQVHVRAHRLLTQHATPLDALWVDVRDK